jgi:uncharacterized membrane protein
MLVLLGVLIIIIGFTLKYDTIAVVLVAGVATGLLAGINFIVILETLGKAFVETRYITIFILTLPAIGLSERFGLREKAVDFIGRSKKMTISKVLGMYLIARTIGGVFGLRLSGQPQFVRPLINPMAQGAAINKYKKIEKKDEEKIKGEAAAMDNIANFFSQNIFVANAGVLLIAGTFTSLGHSVNAIDVAKASIPVAIIAITCTCLRNKLYDIKLDRKYTNTSKINYLRKCISNFSTLWSKKNLKSN